MFCIKQTLFLFIYHSRRIETMEKVAVRISETIQLFIRFFLSIEILWKIVVVSSCILITLFIVASGKTVCCVALNIPSTFFNHCYPFYSFHLSSSRVVRNRWMLLHTSPFLRRYFVGNSLLLYTYQRCVFADHTIISESPQQFSLFSWSRESWRVPLF